MRLIQSSAGVTVSYESGGSGPPLVLVHGAFSDHRSNWEFVRPLFEQRFTVHAIARRGRGQTEAVQGHALEDEARDVAAVVRAIGEPVFLLGHSYGALVALAAAPGLGDAVRKLVLYEPAWPRIIDAATLARLESLGHTGEWDQLAVTFFRDALMVPQTELDAVRATPLWPPTVADAPATLGDLRAMSRYEFQPERFRGLHIPVVLQIGPASPRDLYITDALAAALPDVQIQQLPGQVHEGMTTAPEMYAEMVSQVLLSPQGRKVSQPLPG